MCGIPELNHFDEKFINIPSGRNEFKNPTIVVFQLGLYDVLAY